MSDKRRPDELLESLLDYEHDDPAAPAVEDLTVAERDAALVSLGLDPDALRAKGAAHAEKLLGRAGAPPVHATDAPATAAAGGAGPVLWIAAGVVVVALAAHFVLRGGKGLPPPAPSEDAGAHDATVHHDAAPPPEAAPPQDHRVFRRSPSQLLVAAREACDKKDWQGCEGALDEAHGLDPTSDQGDAAKALRKRAENALVGKGPLPPDPNAPH